MKQFSSFYVQKQLVESLVSTKLDNCNTLYINIPQYNKKQLQKVQNADAGFVSDKCSKINDV